MKIEDIPIDLLIEKPKKLSAGIINIPLPIPRNPEENPTRRPKKIIIILENSLLVSLILILSLLLFLLSLKSLDSEFFFLFIEKHDNSYEN